MAVFSPLVRGPDLCRRILSPGFGDQLLQLDRSTLVKLIKRIGELSGFGRCILQYAVLSCACKWIGSRSQLKRSLAGR